VGNHLDEDHAPSLSRDTAMVTSWHCSGTERLEM
jgi:hypothetical protein